MPRIVVSYAKPDRARRYKDALRESAGPEIEIVDAWSAEPPAGSWSDLIAGADGLLLTGGGDVAPWRYGEAERPEAGVHVDEARDEMEWSLLDAARARKLPVLGICRGQQVINAFLGGTLWQDLGESEPVARAGHPDSGEERAALVHGLDVVGRKHPLGELLADRELRVNSLHHQAVRDPAPGLAVIAEGPSGVVEALAGDDPDWWVWSVQWHPEELVCAADDPAHRSLFAAFVAAARESERRRAGAGAERT